MKRLLAIGLLGGFLAGNTAFAQVDSAQTIAGVLQDLGLSAEIAELGDSDVAQAVEALVVRFGISEDQVIKEFAESGSDGDFLAAVDALVNLSPQDTASIVEAAISTRPELTTEVVRTLVAGSVSVREAKEIVDAAIQATLAIEGVNEFVVNDIVAAAIYGAADKSGSGRDGDHVIIGDDGRDTFVEEVALAISDTVSGELNIDSSASSQIAVDGVSEIVYILEFEDETSTTVADLVFVATENQPGIAAELVTAVSANQPSGILQQSAVAAALAVEGSSLGQQQKSDILAKVSDVSGVEAGQIQGTTSQTQRTENTAAESGIECIECSAPSPVPLSNTAGSPPSGGGGSSVPSGGGGGGGGDTITDQPPASSS